MMVPRILSITFLCMSFGSLFLSIYTANADEGDNIIEYLYGDKYLPVMEYKGGNSIFMPSKRPRIVEFYSPLCPFCVEFQPEYVKLAKETSERYRAYNIGFYALSCDHHQEICQKFDITGYPTLVAIPAGQTKGKPIEHENHDGTVSHFTPQILAKELALSAGSTLMLTQNQNIGEKRRRMEEDNNSGGDDDGNASGGDDDNNNSQEKNNMSAGSGGDGGDGGDDDNDYNGNNSGNDSGGRDDDDDATQTADITNYNGLVNSSPKFNNGNNQIIINSRPNGNGRNGDDDNQGDDASTNDGANDSGNGSNGDDDNQDDDPSGNNGGNQDDDEVNTASHAYANQPKGDDYNGNNGSFSKNESDDETSEPFVPVPVPPVGRTGGRRPGAGAIKARYSYNDMNRYQQELQETKKHYEKKRNGLGKFIRKDGTKDKHGKPIARVEAEEMTTAMKHYKPGTEEYQKRNEQFMKRLKKKPKAADNGKKVKFTKETLPYKKDVKKENFVRKQISKIPVVKRLVKMSPEEELILDVSTSLVAVLETGVFIQEGELTPEKKNALRDFLDLLNVSLPPEWGIHRLIDDLRRRIAYIAQSHENLRNVIKQHPLNRRGWSSSCTHGPKRTSGYTCGLWKMFHVATVGLAEQRGGLNLVESEMVGPNTKLFSPIEAADTIRNFIENFFTCKYCVEHFVTQYDNCDNNRRCDRLSEEIDEASTADWKELALWLWEVHNEVSIHVLQQRINLENKKPLSGNVHVSRRATAQEEIAVIWPNVETCVICFEDDGTWDEPEVFGFLERTYWPDSYLDPRTDRLLMFEGESDYKSALFLWGLVFVIIYFIYSTIGKNSAAINRSVILARQMVPVGAPRNRRKKERSN